MIVNKNLRPMFQHRNQLTENLDDIRVRSVVKNITKEIEFSDDELTDRKVMRHKVKPIDKLRQYSSFLNDINDFEPVLHNEPQGRVCLSYDSANRVIRVTQVNDSRTFKRRS